VRGESDKKKKKATRRRKVEIKGDSPDDAHRELKPELTRKGARNVWKEIKEEGWRPRKISHRKRENEGRVGLSLRNQRGEARQTFTKNTVEYEVEKGGETNQDLEEGKNPSCSGKGKEGETARRFFTGWTGRILGESAGEMQAIEQSEEAPPRVPPREPIRERNGDTRGERKKERKLLSSRCSSMPQRALQTAEKASTDPMRGANGRPTSSCEEESRPDQSMARRS